MNKLVNLLFTICICLIVVSCSKETTINITVEKKQNLSLYMFDKGDINVLQAFEMNPETNAGKVVVQLPYEGLYLIGQNEYASFPVYLRYGDIVNMEYKDNRLQLLGEAGKENQLLFEWENIVGEIRTHAFLYNYLAGGHSVSYEEFFKELEEVAPKQKDIRERVKHINGDFASFMKTKIQADWDFYAISYLKSFAHQIPDSVVLPDIYEKLQENEITLEADLLDLPYAGNILEAYAWFYNRNKGAGTIENIKNEMEFLKDKNFQQEYLLTIASRYKFYDELQSLLDLVGDGFFVEDYSFRLGKIKEKLSWSAPGLQAPDFKAMKLDSTWVRLSDFKGKVVVVDVWATWCEPCKRMMPLFHQLEQELKDENIAFINVCVGTWVEADLWKKMAKEFQVENNTSFVDGWKSDFVKDYHITGVPRYMIFDEEGRIVSVKAPNPLKPELKELIIKTLND